MTAATAAPSQAELLHRPSGTGRAFWGPGDHYTFLVTGEESGGAYFVMEALVPTGGRRRTSTREDETFYVLEGQVEFLLGETTVAGPGDFVNVPRGMVHRFQNTGTETARIVLTFTPAGIERWFEETLEPAPNDAKPEDVPDNIEEVAAPLRRCSAQARPRVRLTIARTRTALAGTFATRVCRASADSYEDSFGRGWTRYHGGLRSLSRLEPSMPRVQLVLALLLGAALLIAPSAQSASPDMLVSQVYAGGGNSGATYTTTSSSSSTGEAPPSTSARGRSSTRRRPQRPGRSRRSPAPLQPGRRLVQLASAGAVGAALPPPDASGSTNLANAGARSRSSGTQLP